MPKVTTYADASTPLADADLLYMVQGGNSRKTSIDGLKSVLAPLPKTAAGDGNWSLQSVAASNAFILPAGGTLAWLYFRRTTPGNTISAFDAGVSAGGTNLLTLGAGEDLRALVWRIA
jgi:hypothetical protein